MDDQKSEKEKKVSCTICMKYSTGNKYTREKGGKKSELKNTHWSHIVQSRKARIDQPLGILLSSWNVQNNHLNTYLLHTNVQVDTLLSSALDFIDSAVSLCFPCISL